MTGSTAAEDNEISALLRTLRLADARLEELTAGEVDTVSDDEGHSYVLQRAQMELRYHEAARQAAILNALPANVVVLDQNGVIVSVNDSWRQLAENNLLRDPTYCVGVNYLALCEGAWGAGAADAHAVADGLREVLCGRSQRFSLEYPCETRNGPAWFLLTVTPLHEGQRLGAIVMHVDITAEKHSQQTLLRFGAAMDATMDAIFVTDRDTMQFVHFNDAACRMRGQSREEILALGPAGILGVSRAELERTFDALIAGEGDRTPRESLRRRPDGSSYWTEVRRQAQRLGERWTIVSLVRDVTERKLAEQRLVQLNRVHTMLSGVNTLILRVNDRADLFKEACRIAVEAGGFLMAWIGLLDRAALEIIPVASVGATEALLVCIEEGLSLRDVTAVPASPTARVIRTKLPVVVNDAEVETRPAAAQAYAAAGIRSFAKFPLLVADEAVGVFALYATQTDFFHADEMKLLTALASDVAFAIDHIEKQERIEYLAYYDTLTGLANRALFLDRVTQYLRSTEATGRKVALVLIDLERFRNVNDSLGRSAGDSLLRQVAAWLLKTVGDASRVARLGADHFAVMLPTTADHDLARLLDLSLTAFLKHPFTWNEAAYRLGAKTGVALFPEDGADADTLLRNAEAALKRAKASGDPYLFYAPTMTETAAGRLSLENQLRQALEREQFVLHYQPKIRLTTSELVGAEALIRWNDPHTGLVPPGRFIPLLEETGLINEVGRWALGKAVEDYLCWQRAGLAGVRIAVNVSPLQLGNRGFVGEIERVIGVDPEAAHGLELEITESLIMADVKHSIASLQKIRALGVTVAIDDFGTGYSSLSYLARLPINTLKIDRAFVVDMTSTSEAHALVAMIVNLAHSLKLSVVAEGVETEEQAQLLRELGCDHMQGYLFSKPVPEAVFARRFLSWRRPGVSPAAETSPRC